MLIPIRYRFGNPDDGRKISSYNILILKRKMIEWREPPAYKVRTFYTLLKILPSKIPDLLKNIPFSGIQWFLLKPIRNQVKHLLKLFKWMGFGKIQKYLEMGDKFFEGQNKKENGHGTYT